MAINPKLLKRFQRGGAVNPYDVGGFGGGNQIFGDPGGWQSGSEFDQGGGGGTWNPGTGGGGTGGGGTGGGTGGGMEMTIDEQMDQWMTYFGESFVGGGLTQEEENTLYGLLQGGASPDEVWEWAQNNLGPQDEGFGAEEETIEEETPVVGDDSGLAGNPEEEGGGLYTDPITGQQWSEEGGIVQYGQGVADPAMVAGGDFVGSGDLSPEMQQYLQSFMGEDWALGAENQVTNPAYAQAQNEYAQYVSEQEASGGSIVPFDSWYGSEGSGYGQMIEQGGPMDFVSQVWQSDADLSETIGDDTYQGIDWSDPASVEAAMLQAGEFGEDVDFGGIRGVSSEMLEKMKDATYDESREFGRENIISKLGVDASQLGRTLNPELIKQQMKSKYQSDALALEEGISKKKAGAEGDVMDIMADWSDIFATGG